MKASNSTKMMRKRKRRRSREKKAGSKDSGDKNRVPDTIRKLMGDAIIVPLFDFLKQCAPNLPDITPLIQDTPDYIRLKNTLVSPSASMKPTKCRKVECSDLASLVDNVIWSLIQRRSRDKTARNVLAQGYILASEHMHAVHPSPHMRPGVLCTHMNDNVSFCKTSSLMQTLHRLVGDDVLRIILLHTSVFLPVEQDWDHSKQNYLLLCGPPVHAMRESGKKRSRETSSNDHRKRRKRKETPAAKLWDPNGIVPRYGLFYSSAFVPHVGFPSTHMLSQQPANCQSLLAAMLDCTKNKGRKRWKTVCKLGIPLCEKIFRQHAKCDYHRLLNRYCPLPDFCQETRASPTAAHPSVTKSVTLPQASAAHSSSDGVSSFLKAVLCRVFPLEFWGSQHNLDRVMDLAVTFVTLRRQEQLPNKSLMNGIRVKDICWLYGGNKATTWSKTLHEAATTRMQNVMRWLFVQFIVPLLRSIFYVTESEFSAKRVLYYRKPVWSLFRSLSMKKLLKSQYSEISANEAALLIRKQKMGFSRLRLLPKRTGVRALATLSKREFASFEKGRGMDALPVGLDDETRPRKRARHDNNGSGAMFASNHRLQTDKRFCSTNAILSNVFDVLCHERQRKSHLFGTGVFGLNEFYPQYQRFLAELRQSNAGKEKKKQLYFTSVDIKQCYDSINQQHLLDILPELVSEDHYLIQNCVVLHNSESMGRVVVKKVKQVGPPESYRPFRGAADLLTKDYNRSVFTEGAACSVVRREEVMELLQEHLLSHVVITQGRYGERFLLQSTGIPQGSVLSTLLCNYYYGNVEKKLLGSSLEEVLSRNSGVMTTQSGNVSLLVRIVDDFLLITTSREVSTKFLSIMRAGDDKLGVRINDDKTVMSYDEDVVGDCTVDAATVNAGDAPAGFPWCGVLFNVENGEVSIDYSRFAEGKATDALTVNRLGEEGRHLGIRMKNFVRPRCQPILFDPRINGFRVVAVNFCQMFLLCAVKTMSYVLDGMDGGIKRNPEYIVRLVDDVCLFSHKLISKRLVSADSNKSTTLFQLKLKDSMWLARDAFHSFFQTAPGCADIVKLLSSKCGTRVDDRLRDIADAALCLFRSQMNSSNLL